MGGRQTLGANDGRALGDPVGYSLENSLGNAVGKEDGTDEDGRADGKVDGKEQYPFTPCHSNAEHTPFFTVKSICTGPTPST